MALYCAIVSHSLQQATAAVGVVVVVVEVIVLCQCLALPLTSRPDGGLPPPQGPWCALTNASEDDKDLPGKDECGHRDWWQSQYAPTHHSRTLVLQWDLIYLTLVVVANSAAAVF